VGIDKRSGCGRRLSSANHAKKQRRPPMNHTRAAVAVVVTGQILLMSPVHGLVQGPQDARISGHILGADEAEPVAGALATLADAEGRLAARSVVADASGSFVFAGLTEGRYALFFEKPSYLSAEYGSTEAGLPGVPLLVARDQQVDGVVMRMAKGGVIAGRMSDQGGRPIQRASVIAERIEALDGRQALAQEPPTRALTDDRGDFRLYGLYPGDYLVGCPNPPESLASVASTGPTVAVTGSRRPSGGTPAESQRPVQLLAAYFPGTTSVTQAVPVHVDADGSRGDVNFVVPFEPGSEVLGHVAAPEELRGGGLQGFVDLAPLSDVLSPFTRSSLEMPDGRFAFRGVAPGRYRLEIHATRRDTEAHGWWASTEISVGSREVENVVPALESGATINVNIELDPDFPPAITPSSLLVTAQRVGGPVATVIKARPFSSGRFVLPGMAPGRYQIAVSTSWDTSSPPQWGVERVTVDRQIQEEQMVTIENDIDRSVTLTVARWQTAVTGRFFDQTGKPVLGNCVVVLPTDSRLWMRGSPAIREARPAADGSFLVITLPPGSYALAATSCRRASELSEPAWLRVLLASTPIRFTLARAQRVVQDIRIAGR
jgi:hypothetical protein